MKKELRKILSSVKDTLTADQYNTLYDIVRSYDDIIELDEITFEYPRNLINAAYPHSTLSYYLGTKLDFDQVAANIEYVLESFPEQERELILLRFKYRKTLDDIAQKLGISKERVLCKLKVAIRKLEHPYRERIVFGGKDLAEEISHYRKILEKERDTLRVAAEAVVNDTEDIRLDTVSIEELKLSCRAYNILRKNGILYIGQLRQLTQEQIATFRNLGEKCLNEIIDKAMLFGIVIK